MRWSVENLLQRGWPLIVLNRQGFTSLFWRPSVVYPNVPPNEKGVVGDTCEHSRKLVRRYMYVDDKSLLNPDDEAKGDATAEYLPDTHEVHYLSTSFFTYFNTSA